MPALTHLQRPVISVSQGRCG